MTDLEAEREQKQRDFDRKLLLAKSKIEVEEASVTAGPRFSSRRPTPPSSLTGVSGADKAEQESGDGVPALALALQGCVAIGKSAFLPCALVSLLKMEKIGLAVALVFSYFPPEELFVQLQSYGLGKHRM